MQPRLIWGIGVRKPELGLRTSVLSAVTTRVPPPQAVQFNEKRRFAAWPLRLDVVLPQRWHRVLVHSGSLSVLLRSPRSSSPSASSCPTST